MIDCELRISYAFPISCVSYGNWLHMHMLNGPDILYGSHNYVPFLSHKGILQPCFRFCWKLKKKKKNTLNRVVIIYYYGYSG